jgi:hypothetical protein
MAEGAVHVRKQGLLSIKRRKLDFGVNHHRSGQQPRSATKNVELGTLDVEFQIVGVGDFRYIIETAGLDWDLADHSHDLLQPVEGREKRGVRLVERRGHALVAHMQSTRRSVADRVGQVAMGWTVAAIEFFALLHDRLEAHHAGQAGIAERRIGLGSVTREHGPHIDDIDGGDRGEEGADGRHERVG